VNIGFWIVAATSIAGVVLNIHGRRSCFVLWAATSATWALAELNHGLPQLAAVQAVYFALSIYGLLRWRRHGPPVAASPRAAPAQE
jgi:Nicotinamide mononucleotide transporter